MVVEDLTVTGLGADATRIPDNLSPLKTLAGWFYPPNWYANVHYASIDTVKGQQKTTRKHVQNLEGCECFL